MNTLAQALAFVPNEPKTMLNRATTSKIMRNKGEQGKQPILGVFSLFMFKVSWAFDLRVRPPGIEWKTGEIGKKRSKNGKWPPRPEMEKKWPKNGEEMGFGVIFVFCCHFWPFQAVGHVLFFGQYFPIFGFRPVFHSMPGPTRNS